MFGTTSNPLVPAILLLGGLLVAPAQGSDSLSVQANAPTVSVEPRNAGRSFIHLPTLEYVFEIRAMCSDGRTPKSVSLNVADSRKSLGPGQLGDDGTAEIGLQVPASQIAPLAVEDFCNAVNDEDADVKTELSVESALSAQASLLCEGKDDHAMTYVSQPLDIALVCEAHSEQEEPLPE